ncbi:MAG: CoA-binding protein, partial [Burkholderiales bacterium]|nr:CoA-binding protein [Burkholderiales bacterium]
MLTTSELKALLATTKTIAVVGLSADTSRPSFEVAEVMQRAGYRIIPVNPRYAGQNILGEPCVASLADVKERIDIVDCFRRSEEMVEVAKAAAAVAPLPRVLWMQIGVVNAEAAAIARDAG